MAEAFVVRSRDPWCPNRKAVGGGIDERRRIFISGQEPTAFLFPDSYNFCREVRCLKRVILSLLLCLVAFCLCTCAENESEPKPDYRQLMAEAAHEGSIRIGRKAENLQKIGKDDKAYISFDELYLLSRCLCTVYGNARYGDDFRFRAGEVILNRMAADGYPDDMPSVIEELVGDDREIEKCTCPTRASVQLALRLLEGERSMTAEVLTISDKPVGEVYASFHDKLLGDTYFCKQKTD